MSSPTPITLAYLRARRYLKKAADAHAERDFATAIELIIESVDYIRSVEGLDVQTKNTYSQRAFSEARTIILNA